MNKTVRTILTIALAATFLFSVAYAFSSDEQDFLSFFFDEHQVDVIQDYQQQYTANEFLALKIQGRVPALPAAVKPEPVAPVQEQVEQPSLEQEETVAQALVFEAVTSLE